MRFFIAGCLIFAGLVLVLVMVSGGGCGKRPEAINTDKSKKTSADPVERAYQMVKNATTIANYRDALDKVNTHLNSSDKDPIAKLSDSDRTLLAKQFELTENEIEFIADGRFQPLDAAHLSNQLFLRDTANTLKVAALNKVEQARLVCEWVAQQVVLQEPAERWFPPRWTLVLGEGTTAERAMLIAGLLKQLEIDACALKSPPSKDDSASAPLLIGVLSGDEIYVFDPVLGTPVAGSNGKGIATWKEIQSTPKLASKHGFEEKQISKLKPHLICSLPELSPRMRHLEESLIEHGEPVALAVKPRSYFDRWQKQSKETGVWINDADRNSPLRALKFFIPEDGEGAGEYPTIGAYQSRLVPAESFVIRLGKLGIREGQLYPDAYQRLKLSSYGLFIKYALEPRQLMLQGDLNSMNKRTNIIREALRDIEFAPLNANEFQRKIEEWKKRVNNAYLALKDNANAEHIISMIWGEDLFLHGLLTSPEDGSFRKYPKKLLTYMLMAVVQPEIQREFRWLSGQRWHTKAVVDDSIWRQKKLTKRPVGLQESAKQAKRSWSAAQRWWQKYLAAYDLNIASVKDRVDGISQAVAFAISQWDQLATDLTRAAHAKCLLAETFHRMGENEEAQQHWQEAMHEITAWLKDEYLRNELNSFVDAARKQAANSQVVSITLDRLTNLLDADGSLAILKKRAEIHLAK